MKPITTITIAALAVSLSALPVRAQNAPQPPPRPGGNNNSQGNDPFGGPGGPGGQGGPGNFQGGQRRNGSQGGQGNFQSGFRPPLHPLMKALDTNNDGIIDADEIAHAVENLKKLDKNHDGKLTEDELRPEGAPGGQGERGGFQGQGGGRNFGGPPGQGGQGGFGGPDEQQNGQGPGNRGNGQGGGQGMPSTQDIVARLMQNDKNGDGKISKDELPAQLQWMFERADTNHDGFIDKAEAEAFAKQLSQNGGNNQRQRPNGPPGGQQTGGGPQENQPNRPSRPPSDQ